MNNDRSPTPTEQTLDALVDSLAHLHEQLTALAALALALDDRPLARSLRRMHDALGAAGGRAVTLRHRERMRTW